ncbi:MAG TPA: hypothetical protein VMX54_14195 [Vicinamibacteria bacterium]|nr:hypothetical protein [Vicinamibacteria bacterium]
MSELQVPVPRELSRLERLGLPVGGAFTLLTLIGLLVDRTQFFRSWLFAFLFWLGIAVGSLGLTMLNRLTGGLWGAVPRRFHEAAARTLPWMAIAFLPVLLGVASLYPWAGPGAAADELIQRKAAYLNVPFFAARAVVYFGVWSLLALTLARWSWQQDQAPDRQRGRRIQGLSGVGLVLLAGTTTFAAVDWGMSLAPHWFSTMYGVLYIVGWTLSALSFTIVLMARLAPEPPFDVALRPITVQDLGKLLLTFTMLWGYVNFSQWLIIWSGNTTEETPFYVRRLQGGWEVVGAALVLFHFALPFALLLSRPLKRSARALSVVAWLMLVMQVVDLYWLIAPDLMGHGTRAVPLRVHWLDFSAVLGIGGLWLYLLLRQARRRPVLPLGEPEVRALLAAPAEAH